MTAMGDGEIDDQIHLTRTIDTEFYYFAKQESAFIANPEQENTSAGDTAALLLRNPEGSGHTAIFAGVSSSPAARSYARIYDGFDDTPVNGNPEVVDNVLLGTANGGPPETGVLEASRDPTYSVTTPDDIHLSDVVGGDSVGNNSIGGNVELPILMLEPGRDAVVEVEKLGTGPDEVPIRARWFEVPVVFSEREHKRPIEEVYE